MKKFLDIIEFTGCKTNAGYYIQMNRNGEQIHLPNYIGDMGIILSSQISIIKELNLILLEQIYHVYPIGNTLLMCRRSNIVKDCFYP